MWVEVEGIDCNVPYDKEESRPFENSERFDEMPLEEALNDETLTFRKIFLTLNVLKKIKIIVDRKETMVIIIIVRCI